MYNVTEALVLKNLIIHIPWYMQLQTTGCILTLFENRLMSSLKQIINKFEIFNRCKQIPSRNPTLVYNTTVGMIIFPRY